MLSIDHYSRILPSCMNACMHAACVHMCTQTLCMHGYISLNRNHSYSWASTRGHGPHELRQQRQSKKTHRADDLGLGF